MTSPKFDEQHVLHALRHYLPTQSPLKDFIHHNSLHAFQGSPFYDAIFQASTMFGFQATTPLVDFRAMHANGRINDDVLNRVISERHGAEHATLWRQKALQQQYDAHIEPRVGQLRALWKQHYQIDLINNCSQVIRSSRYTAQSSESNLLRSTNLNPSLS
jgi:hypothetical protein